MTDKYVHYFSLSDFDLDSDCLRSLLPGLFCLLLQICAYDVLICI